MDDTAKFLKKVDIFSLLTVAEIKNIGDGDVTQVNWSISIVGGILDRIDIFDIGTIDSLEAGGLESIQTDTSVRGLGRVRIIVSAEGAEKTEGEKTDESYDTGYHIITFEQKAGIDQDYRSGNSASQ